MEEYLSQSFTILISVSTSHGCGCRVFNQLRLKLYDSAPRHPLEEITDINKENVYWECESYARPQGDESN